MSIFGDILGHVMGVSVGISTSFFKESYVASVLQQEFGKCRKSLPASTLSRTGASNLCFQFRGGGGVEGEGVTV